MDPLFSPDTGKTLAEIGLEGDSLRTAGELRKRLGPELGRRAAELLTLRRRARGRLADPETLFLTPKGLEQATPREVAEARAARMAALAPGATVLDATIGIGGDALALAAAGLRVLGLDHDFPTARCAAANLRLGAALVVQADAGAPPLAPEARDLLVIDPDRRDETGRRSSPEAWSPTLRDALELARGFRGACLKLPPGFDVDRARPLLGDLPASWQWTSLRRELKEVALWTGDLARAVDDGGGGGGEREVLALDGDGSAVELAGTPSEGDEGRHLTRAEAEEVSWIAEPDPALIRSGLLGSFARDRAVTPLGPALAYLGGAARAPRSPLLRVWRVLGHAPVDRRRVRALLAAHDVGPLTVKKRGHPATAETLARRLRGPGRHRGLLIVARLERGHRAYLVEPLT